MVDAAGRRVEWSDAPRPDAFSSAIARSGSPGTRASAARHALALGAREHGGITTWGSIRGDPRKAFDRHCHERNGAKHLSANFALSRFDEALDAQTLADL